ncbi:carbohydrate-binding protein [Actinoplanes bogorensis]|uniref:Carbohydrate-binding protein n=1 Tax=Paractinoplanes bogorensis TaxID=1610840 RepID=A0ABS5YUI4_9ACTN|nr:CBM35 domain-containing protein [Actinoplanes bogorensis]MBU2666363.1 carbohydrate-binding protein [Actinoplanes bogorensis]
MKVAAVALLLSAFAVAPAPINAAPSVITVDAGQRFGPLKKAGLGTLFGFAATPATPRDLTSGSQLWLSQHASADGDASYPTSTEAVASKLNGTGVRMIVRYNDLMGGWPYQWKGTADWFAKVDSATRSIQKYRDLVLAVAPFNEPDNKLQGGFAQDPNVPGASYDEKFRWLWTQTFRRIRAIDAQVKIMGPNFEHYRPWEPDLQARMRAFLSNAVATGTTPNMIGWHSLGASPGDVPEGLSRYYRPLENELGVPGRPLPVVIEEYGPGTGDFEGVPGTMVKHWAEFERYGVDYGAMGIYTNPGLLGNTLRRTGNGLQPNAGWFMMNWYRSMAGQRVFVSRWDTRRYQASDAVATYDDGSQSLTVLAGGEQGDVDVRITNLPQRGNVRVRLETTRWSRDPYAVDQRVERQGDPRTGTYQLFDQTMTLDSSGGVTVPIKRMEQYDGYRIVISPPANPVTPSTVYEAERATATHVVQHQAAKLASGNAYVGGIDFADSALTFAVQAPTTGLYEVQVRYANGTAATSTHQVTVNGTGQGEITYPSTGGWADTTMGTVTKRLVLKAGTNQVRLTKGNGYAEVDFLDVRPDQHRYEAELAAVTNARIGHYGYNEFPDLVGGIDNPDSAVEFTVEVPMAATYRLDIGYANGLPGTATHRVLVNGVERGVASYPSTNEWLTGPRQDAVLRHSFVDVPLAAGVNRVRLAKGDGYAELDYLAIQ